MERSDVVVTASPLTGGIVRRPATTADDALVARLFAESRPDLDALPADVRGPLLALQVNAQLADYAATYPAASHEVVVADGTDVGRVVVATGDSETRVVDIVIGREHRRRGIASAVLSDVIATADEHGHPVVLSVWATNHGARALYTALGFDVVDSDGTHLHLRRGASDRRSDRVSALHR
ncbi:GNAT family N-acetyltransferase [Aeromicrobium endophyticum]|uniref:GNAT family N-acetyltransferase n=1 Tax=Aeromicrobium endophyticum TaxID=2292704 RepID=A0A371PAR9_9ACTN|nr:GNAT family N-acetyltransferase [Aeromicrobium endophyticum]REK73001.1 GNAT family N-acetyltransferase [Aeromicrobium endophyticum]